MRHRKDGLYRRDNGNISFRFKDEDGKCKEHYTGTTDRDTALDIKEQFLRDLNDGVLPTEMGKWRLDQAERWWNEHRKSRIAEGTAKSERYRLQHFERILGNKRLDKIRNHDIDFYQDRRLKEGVGARTINKEILLLSQILKKAKAWGRLRDDYKALRTQETDIGRALTRDQLSALAQIAEMNKDWECAFYGSVLAANTGLRGGEIKKLQIGSIDLEKRQLRIFRSTTKTDAGARHIELNRDAAEAAWRLLFRARFHGATEPDHYLMPKYLSRIKYGNDKGGKGYDPRQHQMYWDTAWHTLTTAVRCPGCRELQAPAEVCQNDKCKSDMRDVKSPTEGLRFHDLRHTFITHMVERGVPIGTIQALVGHMSGRMVRHYTHISSGAARKAVELLDLEPMLTSRIAS